MYHLPKQTKVLVVWALRLDPICNGESQRASEPGESAVNRTSQSQEMEDAQIEMFREIVWLSMKVDQEFRYYLDQVCIIVLDG